jgi:septal ring factor EnvC (AmiA/AmiB activator)
VNDPNYSSYGAVGAVYADDDPLFGAVPGGAVHGGAVYTETYAYEAYPEQQYADYHQQQYQQYAEQPQYVEPVPEFQVYYEPEPEPEFEAEAEFEAEPESSYEAHEEPEPAPEPEPAAEPVLGPRSAARSAARSRRRRPAKRSALLTIAVPSVAVMGVAACAAAAVTTTTTGAGTTKTQADGSTGTTGTTTSKLDQQLAGVSRKADDFAERASRTQERLDLKERQAVEKQKQAAAAAAKEAARPKVVLPVTEKGLSAYFGQAGVNWMSVHTGIDFPVSYGTPVMAATDGTVRTQWNSSYGNMAIVTSPDGTETWYCHLSSTKIRSGSVKAGEVIAYSGNSGNSTGPHLHFEVRPAGGAAIDPLQWLLAKGLDPR